MLGPSGSIGGPSSTFTVCWGSGAGRADCADCPSSEPGYQLSLRRDEYEEPGYQRYQPVLRWDEYEPIGSKDGQTVRPTMRRIRGASQT